MHLTDKKKKHKPTSQNRVQEPKYTADSSDSARHTTEAVSI